MIFTNDDWRHRAECSDADPDLFFPTAGEGTPAGRIQYAEAQAVCAHCPVAADCLEYALDAGLDHGVFGGTTPSERRDLLRRKNGIMAETSV